MAAIQTIGVVGAGTMGRGIAQVFARAGFGVLLSDASPTALEAARESIARGLARGADAADRDAALGRVRTSVSIDALAEADYVVEAIAEDGAAKRRVFERLDGLVRPVVILASNTSSIAIRTLADATGRPDRVLGMHFMNPVPAMALVELVRARTTSDATMQTARELCAALGKTPVLSADAPGFIANRVLMPMINEAIYALRDGVGSKEDIDTVMKLGMNHPMGPLALADLIGLDVCLAILEVLERGFGDRKYQPCPLLRQLVSEGHLGRKTGRGFYEYAPTGRR